MIKAIIFDFAGVIGTDGYWAFSKEEAPDFKKKVPYLEDLSFRVDKGDITNKQFVEEFAKAVGIATDAVWKELFARIKINYRLLDLISKLKKRYKTGLLTNYTHEWMNELISTYQLDKYFDVKVISSLYKMVKPDKEIYLTTLNLLKVKPEEAVFIDDRQKNIEGGENAGIKSFLFTTNQKLKEDLKNFGISL